MFYLLSMASKVPSKLVNLSILSRRHPEALPITNTWIVRYLKLSEKFSKAKESFDYLNNIQFEPVESEKFELLISADHPNLQLYTETRSRSQMSQLHYKHVRLGVIQCK